MLIFLSYIFEYQINNMYIRKRKRGDTITCNTSFYNQKKLLDMVKDTKSYPTLEQGGVKKVFLLNINYLQMKT
jgi:hypothetical protein